MTLFKMFCFIHYNIELPFYFRGSYKGIIIFGGPWKKFENPCVRNVYMEFMFPAHAEIF